MLKTSVQKPGLFSFCKKTQDLNKIIKKIPHTLL